MLIEVDDTQLTNILVGLRLVQQWDDMRPRVTKPLGGHFHGQRRLSDREIDALCEELNIPGEQMWLGYDPDGNKLFGPFDHPNVAAFAVAGMDDVIVRPFLTGACE